jgi:hypothetical protein
MRSSDRLWATAFAVIVWLFAGYAVATRVTVPRNTVTSTAATAAVRTAAVGLAIGRP